MFKLMSVVLTTGILAAGMITVPTAPTVAADDHGHRSRLVLPDARRDVWLTRVDNVPYRKGPRPGADVTRAVVRHGHRALRASVRSAKPRRSGQVDHLGQMLAVPMRTAAAADVVPTCFGVPATIIGTEGDDQLVGTPGGDVIVGLGGNDDIEPLRGDDLVCAGSGNDRVGDRDDENGEFLDSGNDAISGGPGNDSIGLAESDGADRLLGDDGDDILSMGLGPMLAAGGTGADTFVSPRIFGGRGLEMFGGPGMDSWHDPEGLVISSAQFFGGDGDDKAVLESGSVDVSVYGNRGNDTLASGGNGNSSRGTVLDGGLGNDKLFGLDFGIDAVLRGGPGADELFGGDGFTMHGGSGPDTLRGTDAPFLTDDMFGGPGDDTLLGLAGKDYLSGGRGNDVLSGGAGNDQLRGREGKDTLNGNNGNDVLRGGHGRDTNNGGLGTDLCRSPSSGSRARSCEK